MGEENLVMKTCEGWSIVVGTVLYCSGCVHGDTAVGWLRIKEIRPMKTAYLLSSPFQNGVDTRCRFV